jgi:hypothetical protein
MDKYLAFENNFTMLRIMALPPTIKFYELYKVMDKVIP